MEGKGIQQAGIEEAPENGKESSHSATSTLHLQLHYTKLKTGSPCFMSYFTHTFTSSVYSLFI